MVISVSKVSESISFKHDIVFSFTYVSLYFFKSDFSFSCCKKKSMGRSRTDVLDVTGQQVADFGYRWQVRGTWGTCTYLNHIFYSSIPIVSMRGSFVKKNWVILRPQEKSRNSWKKIKTSLRGGGVPWKKLRQIRFFFFDRKLFSSWPRESCPLPSLWGALNFYRNAPLLPARTINRRK